MELTIAQRVAKRQAVEKRIVRSVVRDAFKAGYTIGIDNGGNDDEEIKPKNEKEAMKEVMATDDERIYFYKGEKAIGWVYLVYGNDGWDAINDYTINLEEVLKDTLELTEKLGG